MRNWKKILIPCLITFLILTLVACAGEGNTQETVSTSALTEATGTESAPEATDPVTEAPADPETEKATEKITEAATDVATEAPDGDATEVPTEAPEETVTDTTVETESVAETVVETEAPTEAETVPETEPETEAETEAPEPQLLTHISLDEAAKMGLDLTDYIYRPSQTKAAATVDGDTTVLSLTNTKVVNTTASDPYVHLKLEGLVEDMGGLLAKTTEYPYLVLRVKGADLWGRTFCLYGYPNNRVNGTGLIGEQRARMKDTEEWQYICFDLTGASQDMTYLRFDYINASLSEDTVHISDLYFFGTEEEAAAMTGPDVYPIVEQTMDNYVLNIMSFNVQTENGTSVRMDIRADMLRDLIDEYMPDSIGMQEVTAKWREIMDNYVFNDSYTGVGVARTDNAALGLEQSCIFYRSDKYDLLDSGTFWLSDTPDVVGSAFETSQYPRICTYVHLKDKVTGFEYIHMNTHLDHLGGSDGRSLRLKQETVMLQKLATLPKVATVITGDFNQLAFNGEGNAYAVYKLMTGERAFKMPDGTEMTMNLADSRMHAPDNMPEGFTATMTTYHDVNSSKYMPSRYPIDYCFYTPDKLDALSYAIRLYDRDGTYLSDHLPVITSFKVKA